MSVIYPESQPTKAAPRTVSAIDALVAFERRVGRVIDAVSAEQRDTLIRDLAKKKGEAGLSPEGRKILHEAERRVGGA